MLALIGIAEASLGLYVGNLRLMEADVPPLGVYDLQIFCGRQDSLCLFAFLPDGNFQFC